MKSIVAVRLQSVWIQVLHSIHVADVFISVYDSGLIRTIEGCDTDGSFSNSALQAIKCAELRQDAYGCWLSPFIHVSSQGDLH